jgi:hypothetical protein
MHISIKRSGGYAGLTEQLADLDTAGLDAPGKKQLEQLVLNLGFFSLPANASAETVGADFLQYEITIKEGTQAHTVIFADDNRPATSALRDFVKTVVDLTA